jgi:hypothetical protein
VSGAGLLLNGMGETIQKNVKLAVKMLEVVSFLDLMKL